LKGDDPKGEWLLHTEVCLVYRFPSLLVEVMRINDEELTKDSIENEWFSMMIFYVLLTKSWVGGVGMFRRGGTLPVA
jgi:hypothetical protein